MVLTYLREHYGDLASVVGLLVALFGFFVTIRGVRRAKRAAEDARKAALQAASRIGFHLLINEIGTSLQLVREVDATCREQNWANAYFRGDEARIRLAQLLGSPGLEESERLDLRAAIDQFELILTLVQNLRRDPQKVSPPRIMKQLHRVIVVLSRIKGRLQAETFDV